MNLLRSADLSAHDIHAIWTLADAPLPRVEGTVAWSFEGNGVRTRTTFIQAFCEPGLSFTELPGDEHKRALVPVQRALLQFVMQRRTAG